MSVGKKITKFERLCTASEVLSRIMLRTFIVFVVMILLLMCGFSFLLVPFLILYFALMIGGGSWTLINKKRDKLKAELMKEGVNSAGIEQRITEKYESKDEARREKSLLRKLKNYREAKKERKTKQSVSFGSELLNLSEKQSNNTSAKSAKTQAAGKDRVEKEKDNTIKVTDIQQSVNTASSNEVETNMRPGGISEYSKEVSKYLELFYLNSYKYSGWGISENVSIDPVTGKTFYIATQYDGQMAAQTWYLEKSEISYEEVRDLATKYASGDAKKFMGITKDNWRQLI